MVTLPTHGKSSAFLPPANDQLILQRGDCFNSQQPFVISPSTHGHSKEKNASSSLLSSTHSLGQHLAKIFALSLSATFLLTTHSHNFTCLLPTLSIISQCLQFTTPF